jgi:MFS family permease
MVLTIAVSACWSTSLRGSFAIAAALQVDARWPTTGSYPAPTGRTEAADRLLTRRFLVLCCGSLVYFLEVGSTWSVIPAFVEHDLVGGALVVSLSMLLLVPAARVPAVIGARLVLGVGEAAYFIGVTSAVQDLATPHRRGEATSYFTVTLYTGLAIGPGLGEWLYETGSYDRAFTVAALLGLLPLLFAYAAPGRPTDPVRAPLRSSRCMPRVSGSHPAAWCLPCSPPFSC